MNSTFRANLEFDARLTGDLIRNGNATRVLDQRGHLTKPIGFWRALYNKLRPEFPFIASMSLGAFVAWANGFHSAGSLALVTTAGMNYLMPNFVSVAVPLTNFKYQDCGTGTTAAAIGDTALQTPAGSARVAGAASNPTAITYLSVATLTPGGTLAITEWGIFSAASVGTLWDRRVFAAINVLAADSIQFSYTLSGTAGGS